MYFTLPNVFVLYQKYTSTIFILLEVIYFLLVFRTFLERNMHHTVEVNSDARDRFMGVNELRTETPAIYQLKRRTILEYLHHRHRYKTLKSRRSLSPPSPHPIKSSYCTLYFNCWKTANRAHTSDSRHTHKKKCKSNNHGHYHSNIKQIMTWPVWQVSGSCGQTGNKWSSVTKTEYLDAPGHMAVTRTNVTSVICVLLSGNSSQVTTETNTSFVKLLFM